MTQRSVTHDSLDIETAEAIATAAHACGTARGRTVSVAVVDAHGTVLSTRRPDGNPQLTLDLARFKALAAAVPERAPGALARWQDAEPAAFSEISRFTPDLLAGGDGRQALRRAGRVVGGIGVSGAPAGEDEKISLEVLARLGYDDTARHPDHPGAAGTAPLGAGLPLNDGGILPPVGLGTAPLDDDATETAIHDALDAGYRLLDTAAVYGNEAGVGRGIARSAVPRDAIQVITKVRGRDQGYEPTLRAFEESRRRLGLDRVDLYLIHWPLPRLGRYVDTWRAMIRLRDDGLVRSIGVSNFTPGHLTRLAEETGVLPSVNQVELHPRLRQDELRAWHAAHGVRTLAYSPLGRGSGILQDPAVVAAARSHGVSPARVVLRWHVQLGSVPLPRSADPARRRDNHDLFGFVLTPDEMAAIGDVPQARTGWDPAVHEEL